MKYALSALIAAFVMDASLWQKFKTNLLQVCHEWTDNHGFKESLTATYPVDPNLSIKLKGYISPAYQLIDAVSLIALSAQDALHQKGIKQPDPNDRGDNKQPDADNKKGSKLKQSQKHSIQELVITLVQFIIKAPLTWIDGHMTLHQAGAAPEPVYDSNADPAKFGTHWHWIEWKRIGLLSACSGTLQEEMKADAQSTNNQQPSQLALLKTEIQGFLGKRIYLDVPDQWLRIFPVGQCDGDEEDIFYLTRRRCYKAFAAYSHSDTAVEFLLKRMVHKGSQNSSEQHVIIDTLVTLAASMGTYEMSCRAISELLPRVFRTDHLHQMFASPDRSSLFVKFICGQPGEAAEAIVERRRELCRSLISLESVSTAILYPQTLKGCIDGGYIVPGQTMDVGVKGSSFQLCVSEGSSAASPLRDSVLLVPQAMYVSEILPVVMDLLTELVGLQSRRCIGPCVCGFPARCSALSNPSENDVNLYQGITKMDAAECWAAAGGQDKDRILIQNNIKALTIATVKLCSVLLKIDMTERVFGRTKLQTPLEQSLDHYKAVMTYIVDLVASSPPELKIQLVSKLLTDGLLFAFNGNGLPSSSSAIPPVVSHGYCMLWSVPECIAFHCELVTHFATNGPGGKLQIDMFDTWRNSCKAARESTSFVAEVTRNRSATYVAEICRLLSLFWSTCQSPGETMVDVSTGGQNEWSSAGLRAMMYSDLIRELYCRYLPLKKILEMATSILSIPSPEPVCLAHVCIRNYVRLAWKKVGPNVVNKVKGFKEFLDEHSAIHRELFQIVTKYAVLVQAPKNFEDDPYAVDVAPSQLPIVPAASKLPESLVHHLFSGASSSGAAPLFRALKIVQDGTINRVEVLQFKSEDTYYDWAAATLIEILKGAFQLYSQRCVHTVLQKSSGYKCNPAELLTSISYDPSFKALILSMTSGFSYTLEADATVDWISQLATHSESKQALNEIRTFIINNLRTLSSAS